MLSRIAALCALDKGPLLPSKRTASGLGGGARYLGQRRAARAQRAAKNDQSGRAAARTSD